MARKLAVITKVLIKLNRLQNLISFSPQRQSLTFFRLLITQSFDELKVYWTFLEPRFVFRQARQEILHRERKHNCQKEKAPDNRQPHQF